MPEKKKAAPKKRAAPSGGAARESEGETKRPALVRQLSGPKVLASSGLAGSAEVLVDASGTVWEAHLAQVDMSKNVDKFYSLQLLKLTGSGYTVATQWGRTGAAGQNKSESFSDLGEATKAFEKKFKEKAGVPFTEREEYSARPGKYSFKKINVCHFRVIFIALQTPSLISPMLGGTAKQNLYPQPLLL